MATKTSTTKTWQLAAYELQDAYTDFLLSRKAIRASKATIDFYQKTAGFFVKWLAETQSITKPAEVTARHVRARLAELAGRELTDWTLNGHARAIKTLLLFWHRENYIPAVVKFEMPKIRKKRMCVLSADEVKKVLEACDKREKAIILVMVDTGLRRAELTALCWGDVDMSTGLTQVANGKGGKFRSVVIGATARRALLAYRRTLTNTGDKSPLIQTRDGQRFTGDGLGITTLFRRLSERAGIKFTPHSLRRTFTILSLRAGMSPLHLQNLLGHASLDMVQYYAQMVDDDLLQAHEESGPVDSLARLKK